MSYRKCQRTICTDGWQRGGPRTKCLGKHDVGQSVSRTNVIRISQSRTKELTNEQWTILSNVQLVQKATGTAYDKCEPTLKQYVNLNEHRTGHLNGESLM